MSIFRLITRSLPTVIWYKINDQFTLKVCIPYSVWSPKEYCVFVYSIGDYHPIYIKRYDDKSLCKLEIYELILKYNNL